MIVQWCVKGLGLESDAEAAAVLAARTGLVCNWWRTVGTISPNQVRDKLTPDNLDRHINHFEAFKDETPFISLSAGTIERDATAQTNRVHGARYTALWFGTEFGRRPVAYLFPCWVVLAPRRAVEIEGVGEEVRDLNTYRRYSAWQTEGEVTAKISVPHNQIAGVEKWTWDASTRRIGGPFFTPNPDFTAPDRLSNLRELI